MQLTMYSKICSCNFVLCNHFSFLCWYMYTLVCVILMLPLEVPWLENKMCSSIYWELFFLWFFPTTFFPMIYETFFSWLFLWLFFRLPISYAIHVTHSRKFLNFDPLRYWNYFWDLPTLRCIYGKWWRLPIWVKNSQVGRKTIYTINQSTTVNIWNN